LRKIKVGKYLVEHFWGGRAAEDDQSILQAAVLWNKYRSGAMI